MGFLTSRRDRRAVHDGLIAELVDRPEDWETLQPQITAAAEVRGLTGSRRDRSNRTVCIAEWNHALDAEPALTKKAEDRLAAITAGLSLPLDLQHLDEQTSRRAIVGRANDGRFPNPITDPHLATQPGEIVHIELLGRLIGTREKRELRGSGGGFSVPLGHGLHYTAGSARFEEVVERPRAVIDTGPLSITDRRVVFVGAQRAIEMEDILELRVLSQSLTFAVRNQPSYPEFSFTPGERDIAAAIVNLQANRSHERQQSADRPSP